MYEAALLLSVLTLVGVGGYFFRHPAFSVFHPLFFYILVHGLLFVVRPIFGYFLEYRYIYKAHQFTPSPEDKLTVILASNLGFLVFSFFCLKTGRDAMSFRQDGFITAERQRLKRLLPWVWVVCVPIGLYSLINVLGFASGTAESGMAFDSRTGIAINTIRSGYLWEAQLMLASCSAILAWIYRFRLIACLPLIGFIVARAGTGGRGPFVIAAVSAGLLYLYQKKRKLPGAAMVAGAAALLLGFGLVGTDRGAAIRGMAGVEQSSQRVFGAGSAEKFMEGADFANLEYFEYLVYVIPQRSGTYDYFLDNLQIITEPIPRVLWQGKPVGPPFNRIWLFDYGTPYGMTRSLPGEGWFAWGWAGVVIWCGLWGLVLGWIYRRFATGPQGTIHTAAYLIFLPTLIIAYRDGALVSVFRFNLFFLAPMVVWYVAAKLNSVPSAQALRALALARWRQTRRAVAGADVQPVLPDRAPVDENALPRGERLARKRLRLRQMAARRQPKLVR